MKKVNLIKKKNVNLNKRKKVKYSIGSLDKFEHEMIEKILKLLLEKDLLILGLVCRKFNVYTNNQELWKVEIKKKKNLLTKKKN